jgi:guanine deaminase
MTVYGAHCCQCSDYGLFRLHHPNATKLLTFRNARSKSIEGTLFVLMTLGDDRTVRATYVAGHRAHASEPVDA